jgi:hypothetical protein
VAQTGELLTGNIVYSAYSDEISYSTGIDDVLAKELKLYPNPVNDILHLANLNKVKQIRVYNLNGRAIKAIDSPNTNEDLNLGNLASGMYLFVFQLEDGSTLTRKVMKK